jgi:hypothetical protein
MKETIKYFYNVYPEEIYEISNGCYFFFNDFKFYFVKFSRNIKELDVLVKVSNDLYNKNILVDTFILSKDSSFYVSVDNEIYVMLRVNSVENDVLSLKDVVYFNNLLIGKDNFNISSNWANLWMKKVDDFELEISELNTEFPLIQESFDYYVGLAENAISYFNDTINDEDMSKAKINLNHKRVGSKTLSGYINNPLTFTFDYDVRDVSEYIKSKFFSGILDYDEVEDLIYDNNYSKISLRLLMSRLLYPSYYFDALKEIFLYDDSEDKIKVYVNKVNEYEDFLLDVYNMINKKVNIPPIEWLLSKK